MGLRGLFRYMTLVPNGSKTVNIIEEIQKFIRINGTNPVIVINLWTLATHYKPHTRDQILGCRLNEIQERFERFLSQLQNAGASMIFVFKKMQHKEIDFAINSENEYLDACDILEYISSSNSLSEIVTFVRRVQRKDKELKFPFNNLIFLVYAKVATNFGNIHGIESGDQIPSAQHVKIANDHKAMAIMGTDTYYIFYEGSWKFWADANLDMDNMTIKEFYKETILKTLQLTVLKAPLFVTLAGGLYSSEENVKQVNNFFTNNLRLRPWSVPWVKEFFARASQFVNRQRFPLTDENILYIIQETTRAENSQLLDDITETMEMMNANVEAPDLSFEMKHFINDFMSYGSQILNNEPIFLSPVFTDLRKNDLTSLVTLVSPWIQKTAGILTMNRKEANKTITLIAMEKHVEDFKEIQFPIVYPNFEVPSLKAIVNDSISAEKGKIMLMWFCDLKPSTASSVVDQIPMESLGHFIILAHFIKHKSLMIKEVNLFLRVIEDMRIVEGKEIQYPSVVNERALRVSFLFSKLQFILNSCLRSVGLQRYESDLRFDNVYFHRIHEAMDNIGITDSLDDVVSVLQCFNDQ